MTSFLNAPLPAPVSSQARQDVQCREGRLQESHDPALVNFTFTQCAPRKLDRLTNMKDYLQMCNDQA